MREHKGGINSSWLPRNTFRFFGIGTMLFGTPSAAWMALIGVGVGLAAVVAADDTAAVRPLGNEKATLTSGAFNTDGPSARQDFCPVYRAMVEGSVHPIIDMPFDETSEEGGINNNNNNNTYYNTTLHHIEIPSALSGKQLTVSLVPGPYFRYDDVTGIDPVFPGVHALILDHIAERGNFTWRDSFGIWTREEKGDRSITDLLKWGVSRYDVMVGTYTPSLERMGLGIQFVDGHFDGSLILIRNAQPTQSSIDLLNFMNPFEWKTWFVLAALVFFSAFVYQFIEHLGGEHEEGSYRRWIMDSLYLSCINFTGNYSYEPKTLGGRFFGVISAFWAMLITAAYTANLVSLLVVSSIYPPKVKNLAQAIDQKLDICVQQGSYAHGLIEETQPKARLVPVAKDDMYGALNREECDILVGYKQGFFAKQRTIEYNPGCKLEWQGRTVEALEDGFATRLDPGVLCTDLVNEVLSYYIKEMDSTGVLEDIWRQHDEFNGDPDHCQAQIDADAEKDADESAARRMRMRRRRSLFSSGPDHGDARGGRKNNDNNNSSSNIHRILKGSRAKGAVGAAVGASAADGTDEPTDPEFVKLGLEEMAGTILLQVVGSLLAVLIAVVSRCDPRTKEKRLQKRNHSVTSREHNGGGGGDDVIVFENENESFNENASTIGSRGDGGDGDDALRRTLGDLSHQLESMRRAIDELQAQLEARASQPKAKSLTSGTIVIDTRK